MARVDNPIGLNSFGQTSSGAEITAVRIKRSGGEVDVRNGGHFVTKEVETNAGKFLSVESVSSAVAEIQGAQFVKARGGDGQHFIEIHMPSSSLPVILPKEAFEKILKKEAKSYLSEVQFDLSKGDKGWTLSNVQIHRPGNFVPEVRDFFAEDVQELKDSGMDSVHLRHEVPSSLILRDITRNVEGQTVEQVALYLKANLPEEVEFESVDEGIQLLATMRFNNTDNLWAGDGHINMALGNLLHEAYNTFGKDIYRTLEGEGPIAFSIADALLNGAADWNPYKGPEHTAQVIENITQIIKANFKFE